MTCIVGLIDKGKVYVGGDSAGVAGNHDLSVRADRKVFVNDGFAFGFTTSFRMGQLLRYSFKPPKRHADADVYAYMVTDFVDAVRETLKKGGFAKKENEVEAGGFFLVAHAGRLFSIQGDYQVGETACRYDATGCGESFALGSLYTSKGDARRRVLRALKCAEAHNGGVRAPFHIVSV